MKIFSRIFLFFHEAKNVKINSYTKIHCLLPTGQTLSADTIYSVLEEKRITPQQVNINKDANKSIMKIRQDRKRQEGESDFAG